MQEAHRNLENLTNEIIIQNKPKKRDLKNIRKKLILKKKRGLLSKSAKNENENQSGELRGSEKNFNYHVNLKYNRLSQI